MGEGWGRSVAGLAPAPVCNLLGVKRGTRQVLGGVFPLHPSLPTFPSPLSTAFCLALREQAPQPCVRSQPSFCSAAEWSSTNRSSALGLRLCPAEPRGVQSPSQGHLQGHRRRGDSVCKTRLLSEGRRWEWGFGGLAVRAAPGSPPPGTQLRAWHAKGVGIVL